MSSSRAQSSGSADRSSIGNSSSSFPDAQGVLPLTSEKFPAPGSMNDAHMVRMVIVDAMKNSGVSRAEIAERMSFLTGTSVTEKMLHNFSAESRGDVRWPAEWDRAFCGAVGDNRLLTCRAELAGLYFINAQGMELLQLGREYLRQKRAAARIASIETSLQGVQLG